MTFNDSAGFRDCLQSRPRGPSSRQFTMHYFSLGSVGGHAGLRPWHILNALTQATDTKWSAHYMTRSPFSARAQRQCSLVHKEQGRGSTKAHHSSPCGPRVRHHSEAFSVGTYGLRGLYGCETTIHTVCTWVQQCSADDDQCLLTVDSENAVKQVDRSCIMVEIRRVDSSLAIWCDCLN